MLRIEVMLSHQSPVLALTAQHEMSFCSVVDCRAVSLAVAFTQVGQHLPIEADVFNLSVGMGCVWKGASPS